MPRKIIVHIATSADGYIARPDGDVAWLDRPPVKGNYGLDKFYRRIDTVIMGRKTFDIGVNLGQTGYPGKQNYVFSSTPRPSPAPGIEYVNEDIAPFVERIRRKGRKNIWLAGGAAMIGSFLDYNLVDELIIDMIPVLIGQGIPLIQPRHRHLPLKLLGARKYRDGVVKLHYRVLPAARV